MGFYRCRIGIDKSLEYIVGIQLVGAGTYPFITLVQSALVFILFFVCKYQIQNVIFNALPPDIIHFSIRGRPGQVTAIKNIIFILVEVKILLQQINGEGHTLINAFAIYSENLECRSYVLLVQGVIQCVPVFFKCPDITCQKITSVWIKAVKITIQDSGRQGIIQWFVLVMIAADNMSDYFSGPPVPFSRNKTVIRN